MPRVLHRPFQLCSIVDRSLQTRGRLGARYQRGYMTAVTRARAHPAARSAHGAAAAASRCSFVAWPEDESMPRSHQASTRAATGKSVSRARCTTP